MKVRKLFIVIIINIFLMFLLSLVNEYIDFRYTVQQLNATVNISVNAALDTSMLSEEFFSDDYTTVTDSITSKAVAKIGSGDGTRNLYNTTSIFRNNQWVTGNAYIFSMYYDTYGHFPTSQQDYNNFAGSGASGITPNDIYGYLFGGSLDSKQRGRAIFGFNEDGSEVSNPALSWAFNSSGSYVSSASLREPSDDFRAFYNKVGKQITTTGFVKRKNGDTYEIQNDVEYPVLDKMGLKLDVDVDGNREGLHLNDVNSSNEMTDESFVSLLKDGHFIEGTNKPTKYYLTPYSLGVTYVPVNVYKATFMTNLENYARFNKCKEDTSGDTIKEAYAKADGCISTEVYDGGTDAMGRHVGGTTSQNHKEGSRSKDAYINNTYGIINDGNVEYDMTSIQTRVDYFVVDFYDDKNWKIVNEIMGSTPGEDPKTLPSRLKATDTAQGSAGSNPGNRVVAKVTTKLKIHIPYKSGVLQWFVQLTSEDKAEEHYDVALWDEANGDIVEDSNGVWYVNTTFKAVSR